MRTAVVPVPSHTDTLSDAETSRCIELYSIRKISYIRLLSRKVKLSCSFSMRKITENILMKVMKKSAKRIASKP